MWDGDLFAVATSPDLMTATVAVLYPSVDLGKALELLVVHDASMAAGYSFAKCSYPKISAKDGPMVLELNPNGGSPPSAVLLLSVQTMRRVWRSVDIEKIIVLPSSHSSHQR